MRYCIFSIILLLQTLYADSECLPRKYQFDSEHLHRESQFFISLDYILWTARQDGMLSTLGSYSGDGSVRESGMTYPKWHWQSGVKVAIGFAKDQDDWDISLRYTWFYNLGNRLRPIFFFSTGSFFNERNTVPAWFMGIDYFSQDDFITRSTSVWNNQFNRLDLTMYRALFKEKFFEYSGFFGLLGWWEEQKFRILYNTSEENQELYAISARQDAGGVGPYGGGEFAVYPYFQKDNQVGVFTDWGLSVLWSRFSAKINSQATVLNNNEKRKVDNKNAFWTTVPMVEITLGIRGVFWLSNKTNCVVQVGWEMQAWFDHNHMFSNYICRGPGVSNALYTMGGLTVKLLLGF